MKAFDYASKFFFMFTAIILIAVIMTACGIGNGKGNKHLLPSASGEAGEIILVMDSLHWKSELGEQIKKTFRPMVVGLPRPEPLFTLRYIKPQDFKSILKNARNIIVVAVLDNNSPGSKRAKRFFTPNSLKIIQEDTSRYQLSHQNEWAKGQEVLYLFGKNEAVLANKIIANREKLQMHFNNIEQKRVMASLYKAKELKKVGKLLLRNHQFTIRIPFGWRIDFEDKDSNFIWLRNPGLVIDKNIFIYYKDYTSENIFKYPVSIRNEATRKYVYDDKEQNDTSYVVVETLLPPVIRQVNFNQKYAVELRGLWKTNNLSMGGPFISYLFVDEKLGRVYYIDGFVYSPSKDQRESIRELETILLTFRTEGEIAP